MVDLDGSGGRTGVPDHWWNELRYDPSRLYRNGGQRAHGGGGRRRSAGCICRLERADVHGLRRHDLLVLSGRVFRCHPFRAVRRDQSEPQSYAEYSGARGTTDRSDSQHRGLRGPGGSGTWFGFVDLSVVPERHGHLRRHQRDLPDRFISDRQRWRLHGRCQKQQRQRYFERRKAVAARLSQHHNPAGEPNRLGRRYRNDHCGCNQRHGGRLSMAKKWREPYRRWSDQRLHERHPHDSQPADSRRRQLHRAGDKHRRQHDFHSGHLDRHTKPSFRRGRIDQRRRIAHSFGRFRWKPVGDRQQ